MDFMTADLCDRYETLLGDSLRVAAPVFRHFGGQPRFHGQITTLKLFEDNSLVRETLGTAGLGRVLVVDGGGSLRCALLGDQLALLAEKHGWSGIVINGCIRDSVAINHTQIGVRALAIHPQKSVKRGQGERDLPVTFAGVCFRPGDWLYADEDGLLVSTSPLSHPDSSSEPSLRK